MHDRANAQQGMELAARIPDIMPDEADDQIKPVYDDIQSSLRVPFVNLIFRVLANYPDYLLPVWRSLAPIVRMRQFEVAADELRAAAALEDPAGSKLVGPVAEPGHAGAWIGAR